MKIIVVGARGMLGSMICQVFAEQQPMCWDTDELDITKEADVRERMRAESPDVVINAAAYTNVDGAQENKEAAFAVNDTGVRNLATVAKEIDATLVHYSTDYVFPGDVSEGYAEDDAPGPAVNVYGESKLAGERALLEIRPKFYLQRIAWLYGPNGNNFVETILRLAQERDKLSVINDQIGSPTFTKDVALATKELLESEYDYGIYHTANAGSASWFDFAKKIIEFSDVTLDIKPIPSSEYPLPASRPAYSILRNTRGPKLRPWEEALDDYIKNR